MKGNILMGTTNGKIGDIIAKVVHGTQVFSKYQPAVFNPRSQKQITQRDLFTRAIIFTKGTLFDKIVTNTYAVLRGTARSIFINIQRLAVLCGRMKKGASGYSSKIIEPLMLKLINDNYFENVFQFVPTGIAPYIDKALPTSEFIYFGSISKLNGVNFLTKAIYTSSSGDIGIATVTDSFAIASTPVDGILNERKTGFQNSSADCGNWPYVYKITIGTEKHLSSGIPTALTVGTENVICSHLIYTTSNSEVIGYDMVNSFKPTPTP